MRRRVRKVQRPLSSIHGNPLATPDTTLSANITENRLYIDFYGDLKQVHFIFLHEISKNVRIIAQLEQKVICNSSFLCISQAMFLLVKFKST